MRGFVYPEFLHSSFDMTDSDISLSDSPDELIELGRTAGAYGFKGWVRIQPEGTGEVLQKVRDWVLVAFTARDSSPNGTAANRRKRRMPFA